MATFAISRMGSWLRSWFTVKKDKELFETIDKFMSKESNTTKEQLKEKLKKLLVTDKDGYAASLAARRRGMYDTPLQEIARQSRKDSQKACDATDALFEVSKELNLDLDVNDRNHFYDSSPLLRACKDGSENSRKFALHLVQKYNPNVNYIDSEVDPMDSSGNETIYADLGTPMGLMVSEIYLLALTPLVPIAPVAAPLAALGLAAMGKMMDLSSSELGHSMRYNTPLFWASKWGDAKLVTSMLDKNADILYSHEITLHKRDAFDTRDIETGNPLRGNYSVKIGRGTYSVLGVIATRDDPDFKISIINYYKEKLSKEQNLDNKRKFGDILATLYTGMIFAEKYDEKAIKYFKDNVLDILKDKNISDDHKQQLSYAIKIHQDIRTKLESQEKLSPESVIQIMKSLNDIDARNNKNLKLYQSLVHLTLLKGHVEVAKEIAKKVKESGIYIGHDKDRIEDLKNIASGSIDDINKEIEKLKADEEKLKEAVAAAQKEQVERECNSFFRKVFAFFGLMEEHKKLLPEERNRIDIEKYLEFKVPEKMVLEKLDKSLYGLSASSKRDMEFATRLLVLSIKNGYNDITKKILQKVQGIDFNKIVKDDSYTGTMLHLCAMYDNHDMAKELIGKGAKVDIKDCYGNSPLFYSKTKECTQTLIGAVEKDKRNSYINCYNGNGVTPLIYQIVSRSSSESIQCLIENGADTRQRRYAGAFWYQRPMYSPYYFSKRRVEVAHFKLSNTNEKLEAQKIKKLIKEHNKKETRDPSRGRGLGLD